jgi:hypothetical protein
MALRNILFLDLPLFLNRVLFFDLSIRLHDLLHNLEVSFLIEGVGVALVKSEGASRRNRRYIG